MFKELSKEKTSVREKEILSEWQKQNIFNKTIDNRNNSEEL